MLRNLLGLHNTVVRKIVILPILIFLFSCGPFSQVDRVQEELASLLEMPLYEMIFHEIVYLEEDSRFLLFFGGYKSTLFSIDFSVIAGMDMQESPPSVILRGNKIFIELGTPKILSVDAKEESIHMYYMAEEKSSFSLKDYQGFIRDYSSVIKKQAIEEGIIKSAKKKARAEIEALVKSMGFSDIEIRFRDQGIQEL